MKNLTIKIEDVKSTKQRENFEVINRCLSAIKNHSELDSAYKSLEDNFKAALWNFGKGGDHIWISNGANERLILITN